MQYLYFHKIVRNDYHCPICRQSIISLHKTLDDALDNARDECGSLLESGESLWVDEWIRRSNGDKYQVIKITPNEIYNLSKNLYNSTDINQDIQIQYMLLHVHVDEKEDCPDNIKYYVSFHTMLRDACKEAASHFFDDNKKYFMPKIHNLESVWIERDNYKSDTVTGDYYEIIKLEENKKINLNKRCSQVKTIWNRDDYDWNLEELVYH